MRERKSCVGIARQGLRRGEDEDGSLDHFPLSSGQSDSVSYAWFSLSSSPRFSSDFPPLTSFLEALEASCTSSEEEGREYRSIDTSLFPICHLFENQKRYKRRLLGSLLFVLKDQQTIEGVDIQGFNVSLCFGPRSSLPCCLWVVSRQAQNFYSDEHEGRGYIRSEGADEERALKKDLSSAAWNFILQDSEDRDREATTQGKLSEGWRSRVEVAQQSSMWAYPYPERHLFGTFR